MVQLKWVRGIIKSLVFNCAMLIDAAKHLQSMLSVYKLQLTFLIGNGLDDSAWT